MWEHRKLNFSHIPTCYDTMIVKGWTGMFATKQFQSQADLDQTSNWCSRGCSLAWQINMTMSERKCLLPYTWNRDCCNFKSRLKPNIILKFKNELERILCMSIGYIAKYRSMFVFIKHHYTSKHTVWADYWFMNGV